MPGPRKFALLLETTLAEVEVPSHAWMVYAVCATEAASCGWGGWILDGVFSADEEGRQLLPSVLADRCPRCGKPLFRTAAEVRVERSADQGPHPIEGASDTTVSGVDDEEALTLSLEEQP